MVEDLRRLVKELQVEMNRLCSIQTNEQGIDQSLSRMLQSQESWELGTSTVAEKQVNSEPCRGISQGSDEDGSGSRSQHVPEGRFLLLLRI